MNKFKVGDVVRRVVNVELFVERTGKDTGVVSKVFPCGERIEIDGVHRARWSLEFFELANEKWTIYNNDKPLSKLTDEQAAELFNWWRKGGGIIFKCETSDAEWFELRIVSFGGNGIIYRAKKQKSERELFIEAAMKFCIGGKRAEDTFSDMFDAGFKAPKGDE